MPRDFPFWTISPQNIDFFSFKLIINKALMGGKCQGIPHFGPYYSLGSKKSLLLQLNYQHIFDVEIPRYTPFWKVSDS